VIRNPTASMNPFLMNEIPYPFDEFTDHLAALEFVSRYTHVTLADGSMVELAAESSFESMVLRVMDYMRQLYEDEQEALFKGSRLVIIVHHISTELVKFEAAQLAVIGGEGVPAAIDTRVWRALYHFYVQEQALGDRVTTEKVISYANALPEDSED
jgi:hypothetical protein